MRMVMFGWIIFVIHASKMIQLTKPGQPSNDTIEWVVLCAIPSSKRIQLAKPVQPYLAHLRKLTTFRNVTTGETKATIKLMDIFQRILFYKGF